MDQLHEKTREIYAPLFDQMVSEEQRVRSSARVILGLLFERFRPASVLDVGCGLGGWLATAREMGVPCVAGVEGPWVDPVRLVIEPACVSTADLNQLLDLGRRFDLALCLETAEHVEPAAADTLVESLVRHAPAVLFSAAIPLQRGPGHVNEQWPAYWVKKFASHGYGVLDFIRPAVWHHKDVLWWYRQNVLLFVEAKWCSLQPGLVREAQIQSGRNMPLTVVLPDVFYGTARRLAELEEAILRGGRYATEFCVGGVIKLTPTPGSDPAASANLAESEHCIISAPPAAERRA